MSREEAIEEEEVINEGMTVGRAYYVENAGCAAALAAACMDPGIDNPIWDSAKAVRKMAAEFNLLTDHISEEPNETALDILVRPSRGCEGGAAEGGDLEAMARKLARCLLGLSSWLEKLKDTMGEYKRVFKFEQGKNKGLWCIRLQEGMVLRGKFPARSVAACEKALFQGPEWNEKWLVVCPASYGPGDKFGAKLKFDDPDPAHFEALVCGRCGSKCGVDARGEPKCGACEQEEKDRVRAEAENVCVFHSNKLPCAVCEKEALEGVARCTRPGCNEKSSAAAELIAVDGCLLDLQW